MPDNRQVISKTPSPMFVGRPQNFWANGKVCIAFTGLLAKQRVAMGMVGKYNSE